MQAVIKKLLLFNGATDGRCFIAYTGYTEWVEFLIYEGQDGKDDKGNCGYLTYYKECGANMKNLNPDSRSPGQKSAKVLAAVLR
jgi:hypothetical protein